MKHGLPFFLLALLPLHAHAARTATWEMGSYQDFLRGQFTGISLSRQGRLMLAPKTETVFASGQPVIWSLAHAPDGTIYAATGHRGRVFRIDRFGKSEVVWTADQPEVFAIALDPKGTLYAASSPKGKVYRIKGHKAEEFFSPGAVYIWSLVFAKDGTLFVGTGDEGKIYRVDRSGKGEVYYETGQTHVTSLAFDSQERLLAGTEPNGILYRIEAKDKAFVLYDADLPEIRAIAPGPGGVIYAAAQGGASTRKGITGAQTSPASTGRPVVSATATSITVIDDAQSAVEIKPKPEAAKPAPATPQVTTQFAPIIDVTGIEKSALYLIHPDNTVETLWSSKEENIYDVLPQGQQVILATDGKGRIYRLGADRKVTLLAQTNESEATRLLGESGGFVAATGNIGKILRLESVLEPKGTYEAPVHDAGTVARWGKLSWRSETPGPHSRIAFRTRSGNAARPDRTWSDWSEPLEDSRGSQVSSPNARYIQWRAELSGSGPESPVLDSVTVTYLPQNSPPVLRSITVTAQTPATDSRKQDTAQPAAATSYSITVSDTADASASTSAGTSTQILGRSSGRQMQVTWQADDTDGDTLVSSLYFRGEDEHEWKLVKADLEEPTFTLDGDVLADGRYFFRVKVSDQPSNPRDTAREAEIVSAPVLVDNTPPLVRAGTPARNGSSVAIEFEATDAASSLRQAEYSLDAGHWTPIEAADGITDSPNERFPIRLENVSAGEHLLVIRVYDAAGNAGLAKVVLR